MPLLSLILLAIFLMIVFPLRALLRLRRYGDRGAPDWHASRPRSWLFADVSFLAGFSLLLAAPVVALLGIDLTLWNPGVAVVWIGAALIVGATGAAIWAQQSMGPAWRADIAIAEDAALVTSGPFRLVRNPNYDAMFAAALGSLLIAPNAIATFGLLLLGASLQMTARAEEVQLQARFGLAYTSYASSAGRFIPKIGRLVC